MKILEAEKTSKGGAEHSKSKNKSRSKRQKYKDQIELEFQSLYSFSD